MITIAIRHALKSVRLLARAATISSRAPSIPTVLEPHPESEPDPVKRDTGELDLPPEHTEPFRRELARIWLVGESPSSCSVSVVLRNVVVPVSPVQTAAQWGMILGTVAGLVARGIHDRAPALGRAAALAFITQAFAHTVTDTMNEKDHA